MGSLKWGGLLQLSGHDEGGYRRKVTGLTQALRDAGLRRLIVRDPGDKLHGSWAPKWVCQLLEYAPDIYHRRGSWERQQRSLKRRRWLRTVVPVVERDVDERMAAVDTIRRLAVPNLRKLSKLDADKVCDAVLAWAEGMGDE